MSPYDQSVYDAGFKYIPQSKFLLNPFQIPQGGGGGATGPVQPGLPSINMGGGSGGFNSYNTDMSQIRTDFNPRAYNLAMRQGETVGPNPDLFYAPQSKIGGLMDFVPGIGTIRRGAEFLKKIMPINERAIMENEARGMGIFTDDIGRVVASPGSINTGANIMAGYNLNKVTPETLQKRRDMIIDKMSDRINPETGKTFKQEKLDALDEFEKMYFGPTGVKTRTDTIYKYRKDKKAKEAAAKKAEEDRKLQDEINAYNKRQAEVARRSRDRDNDGVPDYVEDAGGSAPGGIYSTDYQGDSSPSNVGGSGGGGGYRGRGGGADRDPAPRSSVAGPGFGRGAYYMDGGRVYYMDGGLADLVDIYD